MLKQGAMAKMNLYITPLYMVMYAALALSSVLIIESRPYATSLEVDFEEIVLKVI